MSTVKEKMKEIIESQPDDASYEEIIRELAFEGMVARRLQDVRNERVISNREMEHRITVAAQALKAVLFDITIPMDELVRGGGGERLWVRRAKCHP